MGKGEVRKRRGKSKADQGNITSPQHGPEKIIKYLVSSPHTASSGASTATVVDERDRTSSVNKDLLSGIVTPESTPTKPPNVPGRGDSPALDETLPYPLDPCSAEARLKLQEATKGERETVAAKKKVGEDMSSVNASPMIDTPTRHTMQLGKGARGLVKTPLKAGAARSLNGQLKAEPSPNNSGRGRGRGKKKGKSTVRVNSSGSTSSKTRVKDEPIMKTMKDFFPVRRSDRRCKSVVDAERKLELEEAILSNREEGVKVEEIIGKGRGVVSTKPFRRGDFVVEYYGDLIDLSTAKDREQKYKADPTVGCYMYYFEHKNKNYCVDATKESGRIGRLLNHSRQGNCCTKLVDIAGRPHLILVAKRDISVDEELLYDYGDRNKEALESHPWLAL